MGWFVADVDVSDVREVHMIIKMETEATAALLGVFVKFTLVHILWFTSFLLLLSLPTTTNRKRLHRRRSRLILLTFLFLFLVNGVSHVFGEKVVVQVFLAPFEDQPYCLLTAFLTLFFKRLLELC